MATTIVCTLPTIAPWRIISLLDVEIFVESMGRYVAPSNVHPDEIGYVETLRSHLVISTKEHGLRMPGIFWPVGMDDFNRCTSLARIEIDPMRIRLEV